MTGRKSLWADAASGRYTCKSSRARRRLGGGGRGCCVCVHGWFGGRSDAHGGGYAIRNQEALGGHAGKTQVVKQAKREAGKQMELTSCYSGSLGSKWPLIRIGTREQYQYQQNSACGVRARRVASGKRLSARCHATILRGTSLHQMTPHHSHPLKHIAPRPHPPPPSPLPPIHTYT